MADDELAKTRGRRTERTRMQRLRSPRIAPLHAFLALLALAIAILLGLAFLVVDRPGAPDERDPASAFPTAGATPSSAEAPGVDARAGPDARQRIAEPGAVTEPAARSAAASAASLV